MVRTAALVSIASLAPSLALAQGDVGLVASGERRAEVAEAFESFVADAQRFEAPPEPVPGAILFLVAIDEQSVRVWRRRDNVTLERRLPAAESEGYALALVASELLEVARAGTDPAAVGATIVEAPEPPPPPPEPPPPVASPASIEARPSAAFTIGLGVEAWAGVEERTPWLVQGSAFVELLLRPSGEDWLAGAGIFVSTLGVWTNESNGIEGTYARHDVGLRATIAGDVGPVGTRLLAHARGGGSAVVGSGVHETERNDATVGAWFVGISVEARQPLVLGLEVWLELGADVFPAPVRFTAFGDTLLREPPVRVAARLGLDWRVE